MSSQLPLLDHTISLFPRVNFEKTLLINCQHLLEANLALLDALMANGLLKENIFLLGKSYSTNQEIAEKVKSRGIFLHPASTQFDSNISFDEAHKAAVTDLLEIIKKTKNNHDFEKVIILDDGGQLIDAAKESLRNWNNIVAVEWTSSGFNHLQSQEIPFPIINMARSQAKLTIESPFIAEHAVQKIDFFLKKLINPKILVIGGGYIGSSITSILETTYETHNYDIVSEKSTIHNEELHTILSLYDVIIGCTGKSVIKPEHYSYLKKGVTLASVSSSDREFSAVYLRQKAGITDSPHNDIKVDEITLLNCGFPITFDGSSQPVPLGKIQLTIALAFASICQAMENKSKEGFVDIDAEIQQNIIDKYTEISVTSN